MKIPMANREKCELVNCELLSSRLKWFLDEKTSFFVTVNPHL